MSWEQALAKRREAADAGMDEGQKVAKAGSTDDTKAVKPVSYCSAWKGTIFPKLYNRGHVNRGRWCTKNRATSYRGLL